MCNKNTRNWCNVCTEIPWTWTSGLTTVQVPIQNINLVWYKSEKKLVKLICESKGWIFCWVEDFWIAAIELLSAKKPIFTLNKAWYKETNIAWITGELYNDENWKDFIEKFKVFEENIEKGLYKKENLIKQARKFSKKNFIKEIKNIIYKFKS